MAEVTRYELDFEEIATALIRHLGVNEGLWTISVNFQFNAKNVSTDDKKARPGFLGILNHVSLVRVSERERIAGLTVDAAQVNPSIASSSPSRRRTN